MIITTLLAVETSCDETSVSVVQAQYADSQAGRLPEKIRILAHIVESQTAHLAFGGVVPEVAARDHLLRITPLAEQALLTSGIEISQLNGIAVTLGPGLIGALMVGSLFAQGLSLALGVPLIGINHVDAHLAPAILLRKFNPKCDVGLWLKADLPEFPALALTVSGGHCHLSYLTQTHERTLLGQTADDACGEAFDKVGKLLGLPYPGGPHIETLAKTAGSSPSAFKFAATLSDKSNRFGFSYSGLKTQVLDCVRRLLGHPQGRIHGGALPEEVKANIAAAFQEAALAQLIDRMKNALREYPNVRTILVAGGVAANQHFREKMAQATDLEIRFAPLSLCSDNATMIGLQALLPASALKSPHPFSRYGETP